MEFMNLLRFGFGELRADGWWLVLSFSTEGRRLRYLERRGMFGYIEQLELEN